MITQHIDQAIVALRATPPMVKAAPAPAPVRSTPTPAMAEAAQATVRRAGAQLHHAQRIADALATPCSRPWRMPCVRCSEVRFLDKRTDLCGFCFDGAGLTGWSM